MVAQDRTLKMGVPKPGSRNFDLDRTGIAGGSRMDRIIVYRTYVTSYCAFRLALPFAFA